MKLLRQVTRLILLTVHHFLMWISYAGSVIPLALYFSAEYLAMWADQVYVEN